ncbi:MAG: DUF3080 domain-containing protein [Pseudomonadales bacterium]|nr:DUF3080 domain-containing protein [Pseudomonadales bacterium]
MIVFAGRVLILIVAVFLHGCAEPSVEQDFENYLSRVARVIDSDLPHWQGRGQQLIAIKYPGPKQRYLETAESRVGLLDFLSLHDCGLLHLVSERNSSLGKVMSEVARYYYEWLVLRGLQNCLADETYLPDDRQADSFYLQLQHITATKEQQIMSHYWNATWGNVVMPQFFSFAQPVFQRQEVTGFKGPVVDALEKYFLQLPLPNQVVELAPEANVSLFAASAGAESLLQPLQFHYGGRLLKSLAYATAALDMATLLLQRKLDAAPLCYNHKPSRTAELLENVFVKYYVLQLQPFISALDKEAAYLEQALQAGWVPLQKSNMDGASSVVEFYGFYFMANNDQSLLNKMRAASKQHALIWNKLLRSCGLKIGGVR